MNEWIKRLVDYGVEKGLVDLRDKAYVTNRILSILDIDEYDESNLKYKDTVLNNVLDKLCDYAFEKGLIPENTVTHRDLFDTKLTDALTPAPSAVIDRFYILYSVSPKTATQWYYDFCQNTNYIRKDRIQKDLKWKTVTDYGEMDITVNLSKPEKDPKAIALAKTIKQSGYPKCQLCIENEGYAGRVNHPARSNHRIIPVDICGEKWAFQYSPYVYYNEHCIVLNKEHTPMKIDGTAFSKLFDFVRQFPHYFVGSNADLPIVGGSILTHEHFQGGNYSFPMAEAPIEKEYTIKKYDDVTIGRVKWPMSVIRLRGKSTQKLVNLGEIILNSWRKYTDENSFVFAQTDNEPHNTITPIARKSGQYYELDLVLRNNITTKEHPLGVYHPHSDKHNIKKENIGLIEVMGMAILPGRLKTEMALMKEKIISGEDFSQDEVIGKHYGWYCGFKDNYAFTSENTEEILKDEIGKTFLHVLEDAGVYKRNVEGLEAFDRFIEFVKEEIR